MVQWLGLVLTAAAQILSTVWELRAYIILQPKKKDVNEK